MVKRIEEDSKQFRDAVSGKVHKQLRRYANKGHIFRLRPDGGGKIAIPIDQIAIPKFLHGKANGGILRGPGNEGDVLGRDPQGQKGNKPGDEHSEGIEVQIDIDYVLKFLKDQLHLPNLKPKENQTFDEVEYKYNNISITGLHSLRHMRRTLMKALQRLIMTGDADKLTMVPGLAQPVRLITPTNQDFRYRQYTEVYKPTSNAVIFFARDCSYSMNDLKCDIVSDMSWWIDVWIRSFYKRTERVYIVHDTESEEVDEQKFYKYRYGGGTKCSSALDLISKQFKYRFPPEKWNIYVFYFSDGENWDNDNAAFCDRLKDKFPPDIVNFMGITQVLCWNYNNSLKQFVDGQIGQGRFDPNHIRTVSIGQEDAQQPYVGHTMSSTSLTDDERDEAVMKAIKELLGRKEINTWANQPLQGL
jgi:uncharacterized sporulation protein YeaH/YhbH (DUF444 family)